MTPPEHARVKEIADILDQQALVGRSTDGSRAAPRAGRGAARGRLITETRAEQLFYAGSMAEEFPEISCPRCERLNAQTYTVPLRLVPPGVMAWQALCGDCFREVLKVEPWDDLTMKPVRHGRRGRRH